MVTVFERFFLLEYSETYTCNMHGDARIDGYHYCVPFETLLALNYNSFILTVGIIGVDSHTAVPIIRNLKNSYFLPKTHL